MKVKIKKNITILVYFVYLFWILFPKIFENVSFY